MINRIIAYFFFFDLIFALSLCLIWVNAGVTPHPIELGSSFISFIRQCSLDLANFKIEIPHIESLEYITDSYSVDNPSVWDVAIALLSQLDIIRNILNVLVFLTNGLFAILNFLITFINILIQVLQFLFIMIGNFINLVKNLAESQPVYPSIV